MKTRRGSAARRTSSAYSFCARAIGAPATATTRVAQVDLDRARDETLRLRRLRAAEHRADPLDELVVVERPRDVVVAAPAERPHAVERIGLGVAEHDHRRLSAPALELGAVAGEHEVGPPVVSRRGALTISKPSWRRWRSRWPRVPPPAAGGSLT